MSVSTEVQRTLVKSPPELWSELSNPEALARHLSELGEVKITNVDPETKVEWEAESASGFVHLKQSGWGTKVTLSVTRAATPQDIPSEPEAIAGAEPVAGEPIAEAGATKSSVAEPEADATVAEPRSIAVEPEPAVDLEPGAIDTEPVAQPEPVAESKPGPTTKPEPEPRSGFFARLFRRGHARRRALAEALAEFDAVTEPEPELEIVALMAPEPIYPEPVVEPEPVADEPASDLAAELASVEAQMTAETTELLTGVLDRLGAAHHRPFSRG